MNKANLKIASSSKETGALLKDCLRERGVYSPDAEAIISYGVPVANTPNLNGSCGRGKIYNLQAMNRAGVRTVPWFTAQEAAIAKKFHFPLLARKNHGYGGTDIMPVFQVEELPWRVASGWEWFSEYVPLQTEFRVWIFRGQLLDIYEKRMLHPMDYKYIGRNFRNGFDFVLVAQEGLDDAALAAIDSARNALEALELDFGAVDVLFGKDNLPYILEVNTAPGVIKSGAQATLGKLANCMADWVKEGYPEVSNGSSS